MVQSLNAYYIDISIVKFMYILISDKFVHELGSQNVPIVFLVS